MEVNGVSFLNIVHADAARALRCVLISIRPEICYVACLVNCFQSTAMYGDKSQGCGKAAALSHHNLWPDTVA